MFKKTIIAASVFAASTGAYAASWENGSLVPVEHTDEGIQAVTAGAGVVISSALIELGSEYQVNDTITFTYNQAKATNASFPSSLTSTKKPTGNALITAGNVLVNGANQVVGATSLIIDQGEAARAAVGNVIKIAGDTTNYFVSANTGTVLTIAPGLALSPADNAQVTHADIHDFTLNLLSSDSTSATYRVAATPANGSTTIGTHIVTPKINVTPAGLTAADATVSFTAATASGAAMDALSTAAVVAKSSPQWVQTIGKFNGTVDVEQSRLGFTGGTAASGGDTLTIATAVDAGTAGVGYSISANNVIAINDASTQVDATETATVHTVDGDYTWMDTAAATAGIQTTGLTGSITPVLNTAGSSVTITDSGQPEASVTFTVAKTAASKAITIPESTFSGKSVFTYTSNSIAQTKTITHTDFGKFSLNGASVTAYGVPMGSTVSRFLWVNNKGAIPATITANVTAGGADYGPYELGTAAAKTAMSLGAALDSALTAAGVTLPDASRANVRFTSPVKAADVTISAAYKHIADADRLTIETSDTIVGAISCTGTGTVAAGTVAAGTVAAGTLTTAYIAAEANKFGTTAAAAGTGTTSANATSANATSANAIASTDACTNAK